MRPPLSALAATFLVIASMLGSGILTTTGSILKLVHTPGATIAVWILAGLHAVLGAYCYGIIVRRMPVNGGEATILSRFFHPALGEVAGWTSFVVGFAASNAVSAIGFGGYLSKAIPALSPYSPAAAVGAIGLTTLLHSLTGPAGMRIQTAMAALKFLLLAGLAGYGLAHAPAVAQTAASVGSSTAPFGSVWGPAVMFAMFAYLGWSAAIYSAGETREARETVPRAMLRGTLVVMGLYIAVNVAVLRHVPLDMLREERAVLELLVRTLFGPGAATVFAAVVAFALLSGIGASAFLGPRVLHTMLAWYRPGDPHAGSTSVALWTVWLQGGLSALMILSGTFEQILTMTGFLLGIFPILAVLGLYTRRASEEAPVPGITRWMAIPLFMTGSGLVLTLSLLDRFRDMLLAVGVLAFLTVLRVLSNRNLPARPPVH